MNSIEPSQSLKPAQPGDVVLAETAIKPARCKNCDAVLLGRFCVNCSQAANVHVPSTLELMHELLEGLTHSDSRLWRTLTTLWFKPGRLTQEFVAGRRIAYLPPFRLYLILSIIFFLILSFMHYSGEAIKFDDGETIVVAPDAKAPSAKAPAAAAQGGPRAGSCDEVNFITSTRHPEWNLRARHACAEIVRDNGANAVQLAISTTSKAMFVFLPLIAFLHMLLYWRPRYRYVEHLLFFIHLHAFYFSVAIVMLAAINAAQAWPRLAGVSGILETVLGWCMPVYTVSAMRRVFQRSWGGTIFKAAVLFVVYSIVFFLTVAAAFLYAVLQL
jgi:hypothetical protein